MRATTFVRILIVLTIATLVVLILERYGYTKTETVWFDRSTCRFRVTKTRFWIPVHSEFRETWLTAFADDGIPPRWVRDHTAYGGSRSAWHGGAGELSSAIRQLYYPSELGYLSTESQELIAEHVIAMIRSDPGSRVYEWDAIRWLDCFNERLQFNERLEYPNESDAMIDDADAVRWMEECSADG